MTYQEIIDQANTELDEYRIPYNDNTLSATLLYRAITNFVEKTYNHGEMSERARQDLVALVQPFTPAPAGGNIIITDNLESFMYVFSLAGVFQNPCNTNTTITRSIRPVKFDKLNVILYSDVFEQPDNYYPIYVDYNNGTNNVIQVYSTTPPVAFANAFYIALPPQPDPNTLSTTSPTLRVQTHMAIALELKKVIMGQIDDFNRVGMVTEEINERGT